MKIKRLSTMLALSLAVGGLSLFTGAAPAGPAAAPGGPPAAGRGRGGGGGAATPGVNAGQTIRLTSIVPDGKPHKFELKDKSFIIDGEKTMIIAGEMHFGRMLPEDFEARVKQAKALGLNAISFYSFWNLAEPEEGKFDFTGPNDLRRMFKICQDNGMWVLFRPGPYCCAEVDYGGIPAWTVKYPDVKIRTNDPKYLEWSKRYIDRVYKEIADLQVTKGGPILMVQMENEYAMVARAPAAAPDNYAYMKSLHGIFKEAGFEVPLYVCDPGSFSGPGGGNPYGDDVFRGRTAGLNGDGAYNQAAQVAGDFPLYAPEVYTAWFSGWGQPIATKNASLQSITNWTAYLLDHNVSWCYYVAFGGTNWGYNSGCNEWLPLQTTYDYGAPIDEAGRTNEKFRTLRNILATRTGRDLPAPPPEPKVMTLPAIKFDQHEALLETLPAAATKSAAKPVNMEAMDQSFGFVLYRKKFPNGLKGKLVLNDVMDYAVTMVNGKTIGKTFLGDGLDSNTFAVDESGPVTLDILVHNLGRISVITSANSQWRAKKGLGGATLDGAELTDWDSYSLPLTSGPDNFKATATPQTGPTFYHATFNVDQPASTFINTSNWGMGIVWVNGHNLGRFWDRGAARSLFLSEHFLKAGQNDITILELHDAPKVPEVTGAINLVTGDAVPFAIKLDTSGANMPPGAGRGGRGN